MNKTTILKAEDIKELEQSIAWQKIKEALYSECKTMHRALIEGKVPVEEYRGFIIAMSLVLEYPKIVENSLTSLEDGYLIGGEDEPRITQ